MDLSDTVQIVIGVLAIVASVYVARVVYRLERRDKAAERAEQQARDQEAEIRRRSEVAAQESRVVRREQHGEDYRRAARALDSLQHVFDAVRRGPLNKAELRELGIDAALAEVKGISTRIDGLGETLGAVWSAGATVRTEFFPGAAEFRYALSADPSRQAETLLAQIHHAVRAGSPQPRSRGLAPSSSRERP
ncbi:hypothetical protein [Pseudonocardia endophytica]|uniref:Uncharacterized protein n=1 Tax=Pseudonocardia endophytica TaxID=401976 RepID=A0A4R1HU52_PSEEN|nr:hypothetical protein [Pseudonocardia endophytica]TCK24931.1 hypothetical protein EV378_0726 [Pseudonocardia endophytica]